MRKSMVVSAILVAFGAAAITAGGLATASPSGGSSHQSFTVVEHALTDTVADTGPRGDSLGDVLAFANPVYGPRNVKQVGTDNGQCIRTKVGFSFECSWTTSLRGGSIVVAGPFYDAADSVLAVTGGTGTFRGASGEMRLHARNAQGTEFDFAFMLRHS